MQSTIQKSEIYSSHDEKISIHDFEYEGRGMKSRERFFSE